MVSKRIAGLLEEAQTRAGEGERGAAHGWQGQAEDRFDKHEAPDSASKIQVGHALTDVHSKDKSGRLSMPDALKIFNALRGRRGAGRLQDRRAQDRRAAGRGARLSRA